MRVFELFATISRDSPRNLMLHNIDEQREIAAVITNRQKMQISREDRVNTGEGWGLEVGEGYHLRGSVGQLVLSSINCIKC